MISVEEADKIVFGDIKILPAVCAPLQESYGMVLREDLFADRDLPPFHRATMDGIAINFSFFCFSYHLLGRFVPGIQLEPVNGNALCFCKQLVELVKASREWTHFLISLKEVRLVLIIDCQ